VTEFKDQVYQLERNPNYWQAGKPAIQGLRFPASPGAEQSQLALINGDLDWASMSIPDIDTTFVAKNPEHHHYWFPNTGMAWVVYLNTTKPPFDDVKVRQAISQAIDRQQIVDVPMQGYVPALDATGLSDTYAAWKSADAVTTGRAAGHQNMDAANQLLDDAGYTQRRRWHARRAGRDAAGL
jgi:peptide/nickel transport system substrate-binding protein